MSFMGPRYNVTSLVWKAILVLFFILSAVAQTPRPLWTGEDVNLLGAPSRDGKWLSFADSKTGNLALRDLSTGAVKVLTSNPAGSKEFAYFSTISPDAKQVAYAWFNAQGFYDLRVVSLDGKSRILFQNEESGFVQPCAWSPDGKQILTLFFRKDNISQIALVPLSGGPPVILKSLSWVYPKKMDMSPDGKFIVYDTFTKDGGPERALFLLAADGSKETRLTNSAGSQLFPLWSMDGKYIYFASDISGEMSVWRISVLGGKPQHIASGLGRFLPLGITTDDRLIFGSRSGEVDVLLADPNLLNKAKRVSSQFPGLNSHPAFSPDGETLAYLSRRGTENFGQESKVIVLRESNGSEKELPARMAHIEAVKWSPDGNDLLVSGSDRHGRAGLFRLSANSAENQTPVPILLDDQATFRGLPGVWTTGAVLYLKNGQELRRRPFDSGPDVLLYKAPAENVLHGIAASRDASVIAVGYANGFMGIRRNGIMALRKTPLSRITEVALTTDAEYASDGSQTWKLPLDDGASQRIGSVGGIALSMDGTKLAFTVGSMVTGVYALPLQPTR